MTFLLYLSHFGPDIVCCWHFLLLTFPHTHLVWYEMVMPMKRASFDVFTPFRFWSVCVCRFILFIGLPFSVCSSFLRCFFFSCEWYWGCEFFFSSDCCCLCRRHCPCRRCSCYSRSIVTDSIDVVCRCRHLVFISDRHRSHSSIHNTLSNIKINVIRASAKTLIPNDYYLLA